MPNSTWFYHPIPYYSKFFSREIFSIAIVLSATIYEHFLLENPGKFNGFLFCRSALHWEIEKRSNRYKGVSHELNIKLEKLYEEAKNEPKTGFTKVPDTDFKVSTLASKYGIILLIVRFIHLGGFQKLGEYETY